MLVPIGTRIAEVIEFCGGYAQPPPGSSSWAGPMMGLALTDDSLPILKQNNAVLAFGEADAQLPEPTACIRCGRCVERSCPHAPGAHPCWEQYTQSRRTWNPWKSAAL